MKVFIYPKCIAHVNPEETLWIINHFIHSSDQITTMIRRPTTITAAEVRIIYFLNSVEPKKTAIPVFVTTLETAARTIASTATSGVTSVPANVAIDKVIASTFAIMQIMGASKSEMSILLTAKTSTKILRNMIEFAMVVANNAGYKISQDFFDLLDMVTVTAVLETNPPSMPVSPVPPFAPNIFMRK